MGKKSTKILISHRILMAVNLSHPLLRTQNVERKEHEDFGWKIGGPMAEEKEEKNMTNFSFAWSFALEMR